MLGAHHRSEDGAWYTIETAINHPNYRLYTNDISLIKTNRRIHFSERIKPIRISDRAVFEGSEALITGWGQDETGQMPLFLRYLRVQVINNDLCAKSHMPEYSIHIHNTTICTIGTRNTGLCFADSGGPLVHNRRLIGIISWGIPCT